MSQDKAMRARVDGKQTTAASVVWELSVGIHAARCRRTGDLSFVLEMRAPAGWETIADDAGPEELLQKLLHTDIWQQLFQVAAIRAEPKP